MQSRDVRNRQVARQCKVQVTGVKMNYIEFVSMLDYVIYKHQFACHGILAAVVFANRTLEGRNEPRVCDRIAARKKSDFVAGANQFFS